MKSSQLFIPDKIKIGFNERSDTYTKKLAYVIYYDKKGVLRKETSWESWRSKKIDPEDYANEPTEGFVLNKGVGGTRHSYGWNTRNEYIRVYDPRGFEFEISVANLLFILRECDCSKGKGLEGRFVYAWSGTELVLLPVISEDYKSSKEFTDLQAKAVKVKDLIEGATYTTKSQKQMIYLGKFDYHFIVKPANKEKGVVKRQIFWDIESKSFRYLKDLKIIATLSSDDKVENYSKLVDKYNKSSRGSPIVRIFLDKKQPTRDNDYYRYWWYEKNGEIYRSRGGHGTENYAYHDGPYTLKDGSLFNSGKSSIAYRPGYNFGYGYGRHKEEKIAEWVVPTDLEMYVETKNGSILNYTDQDWSY